MFKFKHFKSKIKIPDFGKIKSTKEKNINPFIKTIWLESKKETIVI